LPDLVLGNHFITIAVLKAATGPTFSLIICTHSFEISSCFLVTPALSVNNQMY